MLLCDVICILRLTVAMYLEQYIYNCNKWTSRRMKCARWQVTCLGIAQEYDLCRPSDITAALRILNR